MLTGCGKAATQNNEKNSSTGEKEVLAKIDNTKWQYNSENDVYWQVGICYCANPADEQYETLGIFVPGAYLKATDNGDGTYTCQINKEGTVGDYTAETAPMVIPVETPGYSAMSAPADYVSGTADYTKAGFVYVYAGCRGRDAGAPAGVTDLKAAIRYVRYNSDTLPGSTDRIFSFGMSGGGAQSALLGSTGDSELYTPYLDAIGAVSDESDATAGSMCWCPITNLDYADEAYEWNMGVTRTDLSDDMQQLSDNMATAFAQYINELGLKDSEGNVLVLKESEDGIYQAGSYYEYLKDVIETSLNNFLADTTFPYSAESSGKTGFGGRGDFDGEEDKGELLEDETLPELKEGETLPELGDGEKPEKGDFKNGAGKGGNLNEEDIQAKEGDNDDTENNIYERDNINRNEVSGTVTLSGTYDTVEDYIDALNADSEWVTYDSKTNTAAITSISDFVKALKVASKDVGAFDDLNKAQGENTLFGYGDGEGAHFDSVMAELLKDNNDYGSSYAEDLVKTDVLGNTVDYRLNMYNPMYYLSSYYDGYQSSTVAKYWRIRTGINQGDTALNTEVNLALALENYGVDVDFATVWGQAHVEAERTGTSTENFIEWVNECLK